MKTENELKKGFTLVELAICFVIIGLIIMGVLAGREMVRQSKIRSQITQLEDFERARNSFFLKYQQLPGDFDKAVQFWGGATQNGNNNGSISWEEGFFWNHLSLAGLIKGTYAVFDGSYGNAIPGVNVPRGDFSNDSCILASSNTLDSNLLEGYILAKYESATGCGDFLLTPEEAYSIDIKMDDGKPLKGRIIANDGIPDGTEPCYTLTADSNDSEYKIDLDSVGCSVTYLFRGKL